MRKALIVVAFGIAAAACGPIEPVAAPPPPLEGLTLTLIAENVEEPAGLTAPPRDKRVFIIERAGRVRVVEDDVLLPVPALDLTNEVNALGEKGLTGLAFHPQFGRNRRVFVLYNDPAGASRLVEYQMSATNSNRIDPTSERLVLELSQDDFFHQGGYITFGPEGHLWVTFGDGGNAGDPDGHGQNPFTLHATVLRIDVDTARPYAIPAGNPFADGMAGAPEVWAYGLRNPWRVSFDSTNSLVYIADVGQFKWEEINVASLDDPGHNYGWATLEGLSCYHLVNCREMGLAEGLTAPLFAYGRDEGCAVIGGPVYRGRAVPELNGAYFFGDHCLGWIKSLRVGGTEAIDIRDWTGDLGAVTSLMSFGTDSDGEIYVLQRGGRIYRIDPIRGG
jgi:glucose/arabinose dehydrogenase